MFRSIMKKIDVIKNASRLKTQGIPGLIFLILASFSFAAYHFQSNREIDNIQRMVAEDSANILHTLELQLNERLSALQRMAARWSAANGTPKGVWQIDAKNYIDTLPGLQTLEWVDRTFHVRWVMPVEGNEKKIGSDQPLDQILGAQRMEIIKRKPFKAYQFYKLPNEFENFTIVYPLNSHGLFDGFLVAIFDIKVFFAEALSYYSNRYYMFSLSYKGKPYFSNNNKIVSVKKEWAIHTTLKLLDTPWQLKIAPSSEIIELHRSLFPVTLLVSGLLFSLLITLVSGYLFAVRARAEELAKVNALINTILQSAQHLIIATDKTGVVTLFNKSSEKALGYRAEEIIGKQTPAIWHDPEEVAARAAQLTAELGVFVSPGFEVFVAKARRGIIETLEWTLIRKDGTSFPARLTPTPLKNDSQIIGYLGVLEDISEYKNAENELLQLKTATENAIEGIAKIDVSGRYLFVNEAYAEMLGYKSEELVGQQWEKTVHPDERAFMVSEYKRMLKVGKVSPETIGVRKDGEMFYKQLTMISNINKKGKFLGHFCFMRDITERKENDRRIALLASIVEFSEDGMISKNLNGIITTWNKGSEKLFGYSAEEMIGKNTSCLIPAERTTEETIIIEAIRKGECISEMETMRVGKDGKPIDVSLTISPILGSNGKIIGASEVVRDITQRKRQEKAMETLTDKLLQSNTELERFAYIASHDLQEPIRMVTNFSEIIAKDYADLLDDDGKEYLKIVINAGIRMREMIDDLLSYSRLSNNEERMKMFKGESIMRQLEENLKNLLNEKKAKLTHDKLPELYGNPVQILRLLQNLVVNAIKYQPINHIPEVHVSAKENEDYWCISVEDNGLGIKPEFINVIFQPFKRLHTWDSISGTGLGLAICKKIAENHRGFIDVKSEHGKGSVFSFFISKKLNLGLK